MWNGIKKKVKEKGWAKRWDPNYEHDYYENTTDGRVTWTSHGSDLSSTGR